MASTTADLALFHILRIRKLLPHRELEGHLKRAEGEGVSFEALLREEQAVPGAELERALVTRGRHGRVCIRCDGVTFLLPRQDPKRMTCEHCRTPLGPDPAPSTDDESTAEPAAPAAFQHQQMHKGGCQTLLEHA